MTSLSGRVRLLLFLLLTLSLIGLTTELLLLGHTEGNWQKVPIAMLATGAMTLVLLAVHRSRVTLGLFRFAMLACVVGGALGIYHHFVGNAEFEREMVPEIAGWELWKETLTGATPVLAPAAIAQTGLIGLIAAIGLGGTGRRRQMSR